MEMTQFKTVNQLNQKFSELIASQLKQAIYKKGHAYLVVSGGSTPKHLFEALAKIELPWEKVTITLCDERLVEPTDQDSNENLVRQTLLKDKAQKATFISLYSEDLENKLNMLPNFDIVILGMGTDGHTASLFPCSNEINEALNTELPVILIEPKTAPHKRISLTKKRLLQTDNLYLHIVGEDKLTVLEEAKQCQDQIKMPISNFIFAPNHNLQVIYAPKEV